MQDVRFRVSPLVQFSFRGPREFPVTLLNGFCLNWMFAICRGPLCAPNCSNFHSGDSQAKLQQL